MQPSWKEQRDKLWCLVKAASGQHGGDDIGWLRAYFQELIEANKEGLHRAIYCFAPYGTSPPQSTLETQKKAVTTSVCPQCGYVPPFCYFKVHKKCSNMEGKDVLRET